MEKRKKGHINPRFGHSKKRPSSEGMDKSEMIFGTRAIIEAIQSGKEVEKLFIQRGLNNELLKELKRVAADFKLPIATVPLEKLNNITRKNHQGAICYLSSVSYASLDHVVSTSFEQGKIPFVIILDRITDVRNFGAIARSAECAGVDAIVIPTRGSAQITSDAMKTSAGALNYLSICREMNLKSTITYLQECGITVYGCTEKTENAIYDIDLNQPVAIIMGSEEDGISPEYLKMVNDKFMIPMIGKIASLNVSVATGVAIFEVIRQRR